MKASKMKASIVTLAIFTILNSNLAKAENEIHKLTKICKTEDLYSANPVGVEVCVEKKIKILENKK